MNPHTHHHHRVWVWNEPTSATAKIGEAQTRNAPLKADSSPRPDRAGCATETPQRGSLPAPARGRTRCVLAAASAVLFNPHRSDPFSFPPHRGIARLQPVENGGYINNQLGIENDHPGRAVGPATARQGSDRNRGPDRVIRSRPCLPRTDRPSRKRALET